jgi:hypothetical protein
VKSLELRTRPLIVVLTFGLAMWVVSRLVPAPRLAREVGVPIGIALVAAGVLSAVAGGSKFGAEFDAYRRSVRRWI